MVTSQNGWPANDLALVASRLIPGTTVRVTVRTDAAGDLLLWVASQFDARVEDIDTARGGVPDDWGYAERPIRGGATAVSNHASGTAIDLNATRHPLGVPTTSTFTRDQITEVHQILTEASGAIRWGGDYRSRPDAMHFEVHTGPAAVASAWKRILAATGPKAPTPATPPASPPPKWKDPTDMYLIESEKRGVRLVTGAGWSGVPTPEFRDVLIGLLGPTLATALDKGTYQRLNDRQVDVICAQVGPRDGTPDPTEIARLVIDGLSSSPDLVAALTQARTTTEVTALLDTLAARIAS